MSRSSRGNGDGLRRSSRQRRQVYETLNQTLMMDRHYNDILFPDHGSARSAVTKRGNRSANVSDVSKSSNSAGNGNKSRSSSDRVSAREVMSLRSGGAGGGDHGGGESETEEILDIYSRVKRRRRLSQKAYIVEPLPHHDDSNPSIVITEADSDIVVPGRKQKPPKPNQSGIEPESSDSELIEEEEDSIRRRYFLRPARPVPQRFEAALPEPQKRRRLELLSKDDEQEDDRSEIQGPRTSAFQSPAHRRSTRKRFLLSKKPSDSSSDSDQSEGEKKFERKQAKKLERARARFLPFNLDQKDVQRAVGKHFSRPRHGASCADVDPMHIDAAIGFESVGGLTHHIYSLKEMILFPLLYPEVFAKFKINPPRGVLFYGPPGTGKTLVARALANECSKNDRKVAFFMRKGADCLSKWVGESERQLRLLFDQAYSMRPSIIFFDEIDGLAPVRSSRQDQIHSSIVSTLLALMDGLDERGEVVVIGATNRLDAIDPALRRPGRFDREMRFTMPDKEARKEILRIQTKAWEPPLNDELMTRLAARTVGYGGADLKGLCTEAALIALRRSYPQIYAKEQRLALDPQSIQVSEEDFMNAMEKQTPCSERSLTAPVRAVAEFMQPLIGQTLEKAVKLIPQEFIKTGKEEKRGFGDVQSVLATLAKRPPILGRRILLCGHTGECGQTKYFAPALLHVVDHLPIHSLAIPNMYSSANRSPEEFIAETLTMASRGGPCVLFLPTIDSWDSVVTATAWATLKACLENWTAKTPVLILATAHSSSTELDDEIKQLFSEDGIMEIEAAYSDSQREAYFEPLWNEAKKAPAEKKQVVFGDLPLAPPPPPRKFTEAELKDLRRQEESVLRELRIFLREIALRLFRDRKFAIFAKPVDPEQAPDYYEIVQEPMDLSKMMRKVDQHKYECVEEFLADIDLIRQNALEYNPDNDQTDKIIRHRACDLRDVAYALIDSELDWDFEAKCKEIKNARRERGENGPIEPPPDYLFTAKTRLEALAAEAQSQGHIGENNAKKDNASAAAAAGKVKAAEIVKKYRKNATRRKLFSLKRHGKGKKAAGDLVSADSEAPEEDMDAAEVQKEVKGNDMAHMEDDSVDLPEPPKLEIDCDELNSLFDDILHSSRDCSLVTLERLYVEIEAVIGRYSSSWDRKNLPSDIRNALRM